MGLGLRPLCGLWVQRWACYRNHGPGRAFCSDTTFVPALWINEYMEFSLNIVHGICLLILSLTLPCLAYQWKKRAICSGLRKRRECVLPKRVCHTLTWNWEFRWFQGQVSKDCEDQWRESNVFSVLDSCLSSKTGHFTLSNHCFQLCKYICPMDADQGTGGKQ